MGARKYQGREEVLICACCHFCVALVLVLVRNRLSQSEIIHDAIGAIPLKKVKAAAARYSCETSLGFALIGLHYLFCIICKAAAARYSCETDADLGDIFCIAVWGIRSQFGAFFLLFCMFSAALVAFCMFSAALVAICIKRLWWRRCRVACERAFGSGRRAANRDCGRNRRPSLPCT